MAAQTTNRVRGSEDFQQRSRGPERGVGLGLARRLGMVLASSRNWLIIGYRKECSMDTDPKSRRVFSTKDNYRCYLGKWILPNGVW